jgi:hypothetical protein
MDTKTRKSASSYNNMENIDFLRIKEDDEKENYDNSNDCGERGRGKADDKHDDDDDNKVYYVKNDNEYKDEIRW